ncbi:MAG: hypothetical protein ABI639_14535 [Thermoanaerobaculia bacterium]
MSQARATSETIERVLAEIAREISTQDSAGTTHPIYVVQQRRRIYGIDTQWGGEVVWLGEDSIEATAEDVAEIETGKREGEIWTETGFVDVWEFVQPFFTRKGAEEYIRANGHRHGRGKADLRVYVDSGYRNDEWQAARLALGKAVA